jgi:prevent-host-death family protein
VAETYSTYEAKAKLSEILRKVESGKIVWITRRGQPIAEVRPARAEGTTLELRIIELREQGVLTAPADRAVTLHPVAVRKGALRRFLDDRNG